MIVREPHYSKDEYARRGNDIYQRQVLPQIIAEADEGKIVAIDIDSGAFEVAEDTISASTRLLNQHPDAQIWFVRVGHEGVHRFGPRRTSEETEVIGNNIEHFL